MEAKKKTLYIVSAFIGQSGYKKGTSQLIDAKNLNATAEHGSVVVPNNRISHSAEKSTENAKKVSDGDKKVSFNLKEKKDDLGDFYADDNDGGPVYKVSGGQVRKVIADNTRMKVYTRAESEQIVNQIVSENLSFGDRYGSLQGKSRREAIDLLWNGLNSADGGEQRKVALDVAEYIILYYLTMKNDPEAKAPRSFFIVQFLFL